MKTNKNFWCKLMMLVLAVALMAVCVVACGDDGETKETQGATDAATGAPAADTDAVTGETQAPAVDTNAVTGETEAPAVDTDAVTGETEAPAVDTDATVGETDAPATEAPATEAPATEEPATQEPATEAPPIKEQLGLNINKSDLSDIMQPIFSGTTSLKETVMFLDKGDVKSLLYPIKSVVSVTSYDGSKTYVEGTDYAVVDGKLKVLEGSSIPCITSARYYNHQGSLINTKNPATGQMVPTFWGESQVKVWQVSVTYTHDDNWGDYAQESQLEVYQNFIKKLQAGEDVTVFFYGDSITWGACASFYENTAPKQGSYSLLFVQALADLFDYTVKYVNTGLADSMACATVPAQDYVAGTRGTITYVNTAIGGWTSVDGVNKFDKFVKAPVEQYGCDLFVLAFGMNDGASAASTVSNNMKKMANELWEIQPNASVVFMATMVPHNNSNWDHEPIKGQQAQLIRTASNLRKDGKDVAVACMTSVSQAILKHKTFNDYSGNNINHPNDWFYRVYAQTLLQTVIGYENMN